MEGRKHSATKVRPMTDMFANDPVFKGIKRDTRGRFATAEKSLYDKAIREHNWLLHQVEIYKREADAQTGAFIALQRNIVELKRIIADLRQELAQTKNQLKYVRQRIR